MKSPITYIAAALVLLVASGYAESDEFDATVTNIRGRNLGKYCYSKYFLWQGWVCICGGDKTRVGRCEDKVDSEDESEDKSNGSSNKCSKRKRKCCKCVNNCESDHSRSRKERRCIKKECKAKCKKAADECSGYKKKDWEDFYDDKC